MVKYVPKKRPDFKTLASSLFLFYLFLVLFRKSLNPTGIQIEKSFSYITDTHTSKRTGSQGWINRKANLTIRVNKNLRSQRAGTERDNVGRRLRLRSKEWDFSLQSRSRCSILETEHDPSQIKPNCKLGRSSVTEARIDRDEVTEGEAKLSRKEGGKTQKESGWDKDRFYGTADC